MRGLESHAWVQPSASPEAWDNADSSNPSNNPCWKAKVGNSIKRPSEGVLTSPSDEALSDRAFLCILLQGAVTEAD